MALKMSVETRGMTRYRGALSQLNPREHPGATRRAMRDSGQLLRKLIPRYLQGPRPQRLDVVTGELVKSVTWTLRGLPWWIAVGIPSKLYWAEWHELGGAGLPKRPFVEPAMEQALDYIPAYFLARWQEALARYRGTTS